MGLWIPLFVVLATTSCTTAQEWKVDKTGEITLSSDCDAIKFDVKAKSVARITVGAADLDGCSELGISFHTHMDSWHIYDNEADACAQSKYISMDGSFGSPSQESGFSCTDSQTFFYPISTSCGMIPTFNYTIETRPLDEEEAERCTATEQGWKVERSGKITIRDFCQAVGFRVKEKSVARISVKPASDFPDDCAPDDIRFKNLVNSTVANNVDEVCDAIFFGPDDTNLADGSSSELSIVESDFSCNGTQTLFYPIDTFCDIAPFIYTIETRPLVGKEVDACGLDDALDKASDTDEDIATAEGNDTADSIATAESNDSAEAFAAGAVALLVIPMSIIVGLIA